MLIPPRTKRPSPLRIALPIATSSCSPESSSRSIVCFTPPPARLDDRRESRASEVSGGLLQHLLGNPTRSYLVAYSAKYRTVTSTAAGRRWRSAAWPPHHGRDRFSLGRRRQDRGRTPASLSLFRSHYCRSIAVHSKTRSTMSSDRKRLRGPSRTPGWIAHGSRVCGPSTCPGTAVDGVVTEQTAVRPPTASYARDRIQVDTRRTISTSSVARTWRVRRGSRLWWPRRPR